MEGALSGYRVLDITGAKGMLAARILADMGAEVIRCEDPKAEPDASRQSPGFFYRNTGKLSVTLNLKLGPGQALFKRLVAKADVLIEDYPPGGMASLGLGYDRLSQVNPRLIMAAITDFGQTGPYRSFKSSDLVTSALGGQVYVSGAPDAPPLKLPGGQAYSSACLFAATGIMLAIRDRHQTGKGQYIDVSAMECAAGMLDQVLVRYWYEGVISKRQGSRHWNQAFRVFPCRDGYILLSLFQNWETLVEWLASEGMAEDLTERKWLDPEMRREGAEHIGEVLERWTRTHSAAELAQKGQLMRFPWAEVNSVASLLESPQLADRDYFIKTEFQGKAVKLPGPPVKISPAPGRGDRKLSPPGEHNMRIYQDELGLSAEEMQTLHKDGII